MDDLGIYTRGMSSDHKTGLAAFLAFSLIVWLIGQAIDLLRGPEIDGPYVDMVYWPEGGERRW